MKFNESFFALCCYFLYFASYGTTVVVWGAHLPEIRWLRSLDRCLIDQELKQWLESLSIFHSINIRCVQIQMKQKLYKKVTGGLHI